jgi:hypothetical protein
MNVSLLDKLIPKRWILLLRYYLPFFKKPAPFYLACRQLINELKKTARPHSFPLNRLAELLFILDNYSKNNADLINLAKKIIGLISAEQYQQIDHLLLRNILFQFDPEDNQTVILNDVLQRIPDKVYKNIILGLSSKEIKKLKLIPWFQRLTDKFSLEDKLNLILSLPEQFVSAKRELFNLWISPKLEALMKENNAITKRLIDSEKLLQFIIQWQKDLKLSLPSSLLILFNRWLESENKLTLFYIGGLDSEKRFAFFKNLLAASNNSAKNNETFLHLCPQIQRSFFINQLIKYFFSVFTTETKQKLILTEKPFGKNDSGLLLLSHLLDNKIYSLNLLQFLALTGLTRKPLDREKLKKINLEKPALLESAKFFSIELQKYVAEIHINAIRDFIISKITEFSPEKSERHSIPHRLARIREGDLSNTNPDSVAALDQIFEEIKMHLPLELKQECQILLALLKQLNLLLENPAIEKLIQQQLITAEKLRQAAEERIEAQLELKRRIAGGLQSSVSFQRMEELFDKDAKTIQEQWRTTLGIQFFDAHNEKELKIARQEADELIQLNREFSAHCPYPIL